MLGPLKVYLNYIRTGNYYNADCYKNVLPYFVKLFPYYYPG